MTLLALVLVLAAGSFHATWNLLAKRGSSGVSGPAFVWLCTALSMLIFAPVVAIVLSENPHVGTLGLLFMFGTGILHTGYFLSLQEGYRVGDLSMIYPLARGTGPLLASAAAIALFDERPGPLGAAGILLIVSGVFLLAWEPDSGSRGSAKKKKWLGMAFGLLTGVFIASYTLWDKYAVSDLSLSPILYYWASLLVEALLLTPLALRDKEKVRAAWRAHWLETLGVAVLSPLSYVLVLIALVFTPVSQVAPAREIGILIGTLMGGRLLAEGGLRQRLVASGLMVVGIAALAVG
jgi:drug/metabolite transporter (DMT)-like permease